MNKKLKSFHKLFFIILFSVLFATIIGNDTAPNLANKIAPELEQIEALPRRTKPAELNIEVTKIKSEPLEEVYIDRENKNIYVDFSKKREQALKGVKNVEDLEKKYNLVISEKTQSNGEVIGKGRTKMVANPQVMAYEMDELDGKMMLKIPYENEPEKLYISVQENNQVIKVYFINMGKIRTVGTNRNITEEKVVIVNLQGGIENWRNAKFVFNLDGTLTFNETGATNEKTENVDPNKVQIIKNSGFNSENDGFINSFRQNVNIKVNSLGGKDSGIKSLYKGDQNSDEAQFYYTQKPSGNGQDGIAIKFLTNGNLTFRFPQIDSSGNVTYTINIKHLEIGTGNRKEHTLIINSNVQLIKRREATITYLKGYDNVQSDFDTNGFPNRSVLSTTIQSLNGEFVTGIGYPHETYITVQQIDPAGNLIPNDEKSAGRTSANDFVILDMHDVTITFLRNAGELRLNMKTLDNKKSYRYKITHRNSNSPTGTIIMEDILNINCLEPFVVSSGGDLDFGKIYTMGNPKDVTKEIDIELLYNSENIVVEYSLDASEVHLDEENNKLLTKFKLGEERKDSNNSKRRNIKLTGIIEGESIKGASPGTYKKTLQLLIHIQ